jgi:hypothetical protein
VSHPIQEEDHIATGKIVATAIISLLIFGIGVVWAVTILQGEAHHVVQQAGPPGPASAGAPEVGIVYQWPFNVSHYAADEAAARKGWLESYGWVDKSAGVVHVPIEQAMQRYVQQAGGGK